MMDSRYWVQETRKAAGHAQFVADVQAGLGQQAKSLPCKYIYDARGSELFEQICALPSYYPLRAETEIIERDAAQVVAACRTPCDLVELGSGSADKTGPLLAALAARQGKVHYYPIDVSRAALEDSAKRMVAAHAGLTIHALAGDYQSALRQLPDSEHGRLFAWLGSSIGNLDRGSAARFLADLPLRAGDRLFVGVDLRKDKAVLERAYDEPEGVTARFIANVLVRINRELKADFDLEAFEYRASYDEGEGRVVMSLVSVRDQRPTIGALEMPITLRAGEAIHVESSYKYSDREIDELAERAGLVVERRFHDVGRRFCDILMKRS